MTKKIGRGTLSTRRTVDNRSKGTVPLPKEVNVLKKMLHLHGLGKVRIHPHANQRMGERNVIYFEVLQALSKARHQASKDRFNYDYQSWEYSLEGKTLDSRSLRIGVAFEKDPNSNERLLVITVIDINE